MYQVAVTIFFSSSTQFKPWTVYVRQYNGPPVEKQRSTYQRFAAKPLPKLVRGSKPAFSSRYSGMSLCARFSRLLEAVVPWKLFSDTT